MSKVQTTLFGCKLKKDEYVYKDMKNKYEQFIERFYQRSRDTIRGKGRQDLIKAAQVIAITKYMYL